MTEVSMPRRAGLFISHANPEDNHFVRWLGAKLDAMGYEVWADVMRLHGGVDWARELERALRYQAVKMLVVCTQNGLAKRGVRNEIEIAVGVAAKLGDDTFIIPLRLEAYDSPFRIAHAQYIDFETGWANGLTELSELLKNQNVPCGAAGAMQTWLESHSEGADRLVRRSEPLMSNWLEVERNPERVYYCEPAVGSPWERFQKRPLHTWPAIPHRGGVVGFARPNADGQMGPDLPSKEVASISLAEFLREGWPTLGVDSHHARMMYSELGARAFDGYCQNKGLRAFHGAGGRISWWGDIRTAPREKVAFDWNYRLGKRQIIGQSAKRGVHWHYAVSVRLMAAPAAHLRLTARLVFSDNGMDPILERRRTHALRRSFAKGWRNARWRDMLCAYLWWLANGKTQLRLGVSEQEEIVLRIPPVQLGCPVSVFESSHDLRDEEDPDVPDDVWMEELEAEDDEG